MTDAERMRRYRNRMKRHAALAAADPPAWEVLEKDLASQLEAVMAAARLKRFAAGRSELRDALAMLAEMEKHYGQT